MAAIVLSTVMDAIATEISDAGIMDRVYAWPSDGVTVPCAVVGYPTAIDFDTTFGRGSDRAVFPVYVLVGRVADQNTRDVLSGIVTGATGIKDALDGTLGGAVQSARVTDMKVEAVTVQGVEFLSATFELEVFS